MQTFLQSPTNPLNSYRLILDIPKALKKRVADVKINFDEDYKGFAIAGGSPLIYLASFTQYEASETLLVDALNKIALSAIPFKAHLKNFGDIYNSEIFINIEEKNFVQHLIDQIRDIDGLLLDARYNELPRISIAKKLQPWQFYNSQKSYQLKNFSASFVVSEMLLLKKIEGIKNWQVVKHMAFENLLVAQ